MLSFCRAAGLFLASLADVAHRLVSGLSRRDMFPAGLVLENVVKLESHRMPAESMSSGCALKLHAVQIFFAKAVVTVNCLLKTYSPRSRDTSTCVEKNSVSYSSPPSYAMIKICPGNAGRCEGRGDEGPQAKDRQRHHKAHRFRPPAPSAHNGKSKVGFISSATTSNA